MEPEKNNTTRAIAVTITSLISPLTSTLAGLIIIYFKYIRTEGHGGYDWLAVSIVTILLSVTTLLVFKSKGMISNWDITDRKQRPKFLILVAVYLAILMILTYVLGYTSAIPVLSHLFASFIIAFGVTLFWKVSFHTFAITLLTAMVIATYHSPVLYSLFFLPPIIAWTRVYLKKHTVNQAIGGILLGLLATILWIVFPV